MLDPETFVCNSRFELDIIQRAMRLYVATVSTQEFSRARETNINTSLDIINRIQNVELDIIQGWKEKSVS